MTSQEFADWAKRHCKAMGVSFPADISCVMGWSVDFSELSVTAAEAHAATSAMTRAIRPVKLKEQLNWLQGRIRQARQSQQIKKADDSNLPLSGAQMTELLASRGLLTDRRLREHGLPTRAQEQRAQRGDAYEPPAPEQPDESFPRLAEVDAVPF